MEKRIRKPAQLTEQEKQQIKVYKFKRKKYHISVEQIAMCMGFHPMHLHAMEEFKYHMTPSMKRHYDRLINYFYRRTRHLSKNLYTPREK